MVITMKSFYGNKLWLQVRSRRLRIDEYICQECKRYGRTTEANHVHHIYPIETHWQYRLNILNLISLCNKCHNSMHNRIDDTLTDKGKSLQPKIKLE